MKNQPAIIGLGLRRVSERYQPGDIPLIAMGGKGEEKIKEVLNEYQDITHIIGVGYCGTLQGLPKGSIIIPTESRHATVDEFRKKPIEELIENSKPEFPSKELNNYLIKKLAERGYKVFSGDIYQVLRGKFPHLNS